MPFRPVFLCAVMMIAAGISAAATLVKAARNVPDPKHVFDRPAAFRTKISDNDKVWRLGQRLFYDTRLSASQTISCASCHQPGASWSDHLPKAIGDAHKPLAFRAPTLLNAGTIDRYGWTGRFPDIEAVAFFAMSSPVNMNVSVPQLLARLQGDATYVGDFRDAFANGGVSKHNVGLALSRYVRSIASASAPFDRWLAGDAGAVSPQAIRGFALFKGKAKCTECHSGWAFTDGSFHDIGIGKGDDLGRGKLFKTSVKLQYAFKTPTLRNVAARAPYMHDGSLATLEAVVDHYDKGGIDRPSRAEAVRPLELSKEEKADLVAFLKTLTSETTFVDRSDD